MTEAEFLLWVRGPAFQFATIIFVFGMVVRLFEILILGHKRNLAKPRGSAFIGGLGTIARRSMPDKDTLKRSTFTIVSGYVFHIGLFITIFLFAPHILVFGEFLGFEWPALPTPIVDATAIVTIITLFIVLIYRLKNPVQRFLSRGQDYLVWFVTILPVITGYMAFHRTGFSPTMLISIHILSVELLMVLFPLTKLSHAFTLFISRYYNGAISGYKGVRS